jgi:RNA polymerase sigma factor (sigma-70 family)
VSVVAEKVREEVGGSFDGVYRRHVRDVYRFSAGLLGNAQDAEDATQTTFLHAYRALERGERVANVRAWLLGIARNVCRQHFRNSASRVRLVELNGDGPAAPDGSHGPSAAEIRDALSHLPFNQRLAIVLREIEGRKYEEIAAAMEVSVASVETLLFRGRQALREQLEAAELDPGCDGIQRLVSLQLDGRLNRPDRGVLRAHLRACSPCARTARSQRSRKRVMPSLAGPLPAALQGGLQVGGGLVTSKAAVVAIAATFAGVGLVVIPDVVPDEAARGAAPASVARAAPAPAVPSLVEGSSVGAHARPIAERMAPDGVPATPSASDSGPATLGQDAPGPAPGADVPVAEDGPGGAPEAGGAPPSVPPAGSPPDSAPPPSAPPAPGSAPPPSAPAPPAASPQPVAPPGPPSPPPPHGPPAGVPVGPPSTPVGPPVTPPRGQPHSTPVGPPNVPVGPPVTPPRP